MLAMTTLVMLSCNKEIDVDVPNPADSEDKTLTVKIISDKPSTRALDSSTPIDDDLQRLDLYIFHEDEPETDYHVTLTPDPSGVTTYKIKEKKDERVGVLAFGNLDEDTAEYFEGKTLTQLNNEREPEAWLVLSANNFDIDRIVMVGANDFQFSKDGTETIELRRVMYRIDVGQIVVDPTNPDLTGKEIYVKNIALTNVCNYFVPLESSSIGHFYSWYLFFGGEYTLTNAFGGVEKGFEYYSNQPYGWDTEGSFTVDGPGILNGSFPYMINSNYEKDAGVLNITATGILKDVTHQGYDNTSGEGLISRSGETDSPKGLEVNKCFYGFMGRGVFNEYDISSDYSKQNIYPKLVIELSIDGVSWFYPIPLIHPQPNTVYRIDKVTIKDYGSEYSNFFPLKYAVDFTISVADWNEHEVSNMNLGADTTTGKLVDMYDTTE